MRPFRGARAHDAGAEVIGAIILFGIFVSAIAILNVTAVPSAGLAAEEDHYQQTLSTLNGLQSEAETAGLPGNAGSTVARSIALAPPRTVGQDFFSYFLATPARASGELTFEPDYGNMSVLHYKSGPPAPIYDIGSAMERFPLGRVTFDPHPAYRGDGIIQLEQGGIVTTTSHAATMRFDPPVTVNVEGSTTYVTLKARVINGTAASIGGNAPVRLLLTTEAATLSTPAQNNAHNVTLSLDTRYGAAWQAYLASTSSGAGLVSGTQYYAGVDLGAGGALDRVTWYVNGTSTGNDIRLSTGLAVYRLTVS